MGKILRITTNNSLSVHEYPADNVLNELQKLIGDDCMAVEHVKPRRLYGALGASKKVNEIQGNCVSMLVDEDGIGKDLPINHVGSYLYETDFHGFPIVGNILIIGEKYEEDGIDFCGISHDQFELLFPKFDELARNAKEIYG